MKQFNLMIVLVGLTISSFAQKAPIVPDHRDQGKKEVRIAKQKVYKENDSRFYYLPEYNCYYDQQSKVYFYKKGNKWQKTSKPARIGKNIAKAKREPLRDIKGDKPYQQNSEHIQQFGGRR